MSDKNPFQLICKLCSEVFWAKRTTRKYCSPKCKEMSKSNGYWRQLYKSLWVKKVRSLRKKRSLL